MLEQFLTLSEPLQQACMTVAITVGEKILGKTWASLKGNRPEKVFARVCREWRCGVTGSDEAWGKAFQLFFTDQWAIAEIDKVLRDDYINVDFPRMRAAFREICQASGLTPPDEDKVDMPGKIEMLLEDLNSLPEFRARFGKPVQEMIRRTSGAEAEWNNWSLAREAYVRNLCDYFERIRFRGVNVPSSPELVNLEEIYVNPRLEPLSDSRGRSEEPEREPHRGDYLLSASAPRLAVVLGDPGTGKSTLGQTLALAVGSGHYPGIAGDLSGIEGLLPVFYRLRDLRGDLPAARGNRNIWQCLANRNSERFGGRKLPTGFFEHAERNGGLFVILDGLDEAPDAGEAAAMIQSFANGLGDRSRVVVSSRPFDYHEEFDARRYTHFSLSKFNDDEIRLFIRGWSRQRYESERQAEEEAAALFDVLTDRNREDLHQMAATALLLTMIVRLHYFAGQLPDGRVDLYEKCTNLLLHDWLKVAGLADGPLLPRHKKRFLGLLALELQERDPKRMRRRAALTISRRELTRRVEEFLDEAGVGVAASDVVSRLQSREAILVDYGGEQFGFIHRSFQEYLAAWWMTEREPPERLRERLLRDEPGWHETLVMTVAQLKEYAREETIVELLKKNRVVLAMDCADCTGIQVEPALAVLARHLSKYYWEGSKHLRISASDCAKECGVWPHTAGILETLFRRDNRDGPSLVAAVELAEQLGTTWAEELLNDFFSEYERRGQNASEPMVPVDARPKAHEAFLIGKYPVTNAEFEVMVPGHRGPWKEWSSEDRQPVICASWWEANLFCRWRGDGFRLPTEDEWYTAASWERESDHHRTYPWGEEWKPKLCNTVEDGPGRTTVVGERKGESPYGCYDMAGNVWEWTASEWEPGSEARVLRGGSWYGFRHLAECSYRNDIHPADRSLSFGFRCARTSP